MSFLYFAYGSNMLSERLVARCPSAKVIGTASAANSVLKFEKRSIDQSGKATLLTAGGQGAITPGVLFEVTQADIGNLDRAEGAGNGYDRHDNFQVQLVDTRQIVVAKTYVATTTEEELKPYDWYLALVIAGARQHNLDPSHIKMLCQTPYVIDEDQLRKSRSDAMALLLSIGAQFPPA